jgi:putative addiction module component (TIGR02574 family)
LTKDEISDLPVADRLRLIADLWDSIPAEEILVPESHRQALDEALREHARDPDAGQQWDEIRDELFPKK